MIPVRAIHKSPYIILYKKANSPLPVLAAGRLFVFYSAEIR